MFGCVHPWFQACELTARVLPSALRRPLCGSARPRTICSRVWSLLVGSGADDTRDHPKLVTFNREDASNLKGPMEFTDVFVSRPQPPFDIQPASASTQIFPNVAQMSQDCRSYNVRGMESVRAYTMSCKREGLNRVHCHIKLSMVVNVLAALRAGCSDLDVAVQCSQLPMTLLNFPGPFQLQSASVHPNCIGISITLVTPARLLTELLHHRHLAACHWAGLATHTEATSLSMSLSEPTSTDGDLHRRVSVAFQMWVSVPIRSPFSCLQSSCLVQCRAFQLAQ